MPRPEFLSNKIDISQKWRDDHGYSNKGGVIIVYGNKIQGWVNELRDPQHWQPGCIAISEDGIIHEAIGGNNYDGAMHWKAKDSGQ